MQPTNDCTARSRFASLLYLLASIFFLRVAGQAIQYWIPIELLPPFGAFQGSSLHYAVLLSVQVLLLVLMFRAAWRLGSGKLLPSRRTGRWMTVFGAIYIVGAVTRIAIGLAVVGAHPWFSSWIPAVLHVVLAMFVLVLASFHLRTKDQFV